MSLEIGCYTARILDHDLGASYSGTPYIGLRVEIGDDETTIYVYLTTKSMGMARQQLKRCGFDPDTQELDLLRTNPNLLTGKIIPVVVSDDSKYGRRAEIRLSDLTAERIAKIGQALRAAKKSNQTEDQATPVNQVIPVDDIPF